MNSLCSYKAYEHSLVLEVLVCIMHVWKKCVTFITGEMLAQSWYVGQLVIVNNRRVSIWCRLTL